MSQIKPLRLMIPGPVDINHEVLAQMSSSQIPHYSKEAVDSYQACAESLRIILGCHHRQDVFIINGSGNVAIDAAIGSVVATGNKVVVGVSGFFSDKMAMIAHSYGAEVVEVKAAPGRAITANLVEEEIQKNSDVKAILMVHLETSTGVLNPISEIGAVAGRYDIPLVVDAISSVGVDPFHMEEWNVSICGTSTQKGLESPPGLGIAVVANSGWKAIETSKEKDHGWYSNLLYWKEKAATQYAGEATVHPCLVTMAVNNVKTLEASLKKILAEGMSSRARRHEAIAQVARAGLENIGFRVFPGKEYRSNGVTVVENTHGIDQNELIHFLKEKYHIEISNGIGELNNKILRIGHIGQNATLDCMVPLLFGIEHYLRDRGIRVSLGDSLAGIS